MSGLIGQLISLSMPIVLLARRISVVQFRDVPVGTGRRRRNVFRGGIWRGWDGDGVWAREREREKEGTQGFDPGLEVTQFGQEGWCVLPTFAKTLGRSCGDWWVSGTAQVMESSPMRLQRRTEKKREGFKEGCWRKIGNEDRTEGRRRDKMNKIRKKRNEEGKGKCEGVCRK